MWGKRFDLDTLYVVSNRLDVFNEFKPGNRTGVDEVAAISDLRYGRLVVIPNGRGHPSVMLRNKAISSGQNVTAFGKKVFIGGPMRGDSQSRSYMMQTRYKDLTEPVCEIAWNLVIKFALSQWGGGAPLRCDLFEWCKVYRLPREDDIRGFGAQVTAESFQALGHLLQILRQR